MASTSFALPDDGSLVYVEGDAISSELSCSVCYHPFQIHRACTSCSKPFCKSCIFKWFATQKQAGNTCNCPYVSNDRPVDSHYVRSLCMVYTFLVAYPLYPMWDCSVFLLQ